MSARSCTARDCGSGGEAMLRASILLVSEDGGADAIPSLRALTHKLLRLVAPNYQRQGVEIEPLQHAEAARSATGQYWKSTQSKDRQQKVALLREIASKLAEGETSFVLFHIDG